MRASMARKMSPRPFSSIDVSQSPRPKPLNPIPAAGRLIGPDRYISLNNLAHSLQTRSQHRDGPSDLDKAIELHWRSFPLAISIDPRLSTPLPVTFEKAS